MRSKNKITVLTKEDKLIRVAEMLVDTLLSEYQDNMGGLSVMMKDLGPILDRILTAATKNITRKSLNMN